VTGREKIDDREVFVVEALGAQALGAQASLLAPSSAPRPNPGPTAGLTPTHRTERLFFDTQSGLLLRRTVLTPSVLGLDPEQTDFKDYTEVDGVKLAFITIVSYLDDSDLGTTRKYIDVKQNVPIDDSKFEAPPK